MGTSTPGQFLRTKNFYNWIKQSSGKNSPTDFYYFNIYFLAYDGDSSFLSQNQESIEKLRYCIQSIDFPNINFTSYTNGDGSSNGNTTLDASNMYGTYTIFGNSFLGISQKTLSVQILNTQSPIIEKFIYPWMIKCLSQGSTTKTSSSKYPFSRLNMVVKFYKANDMTVEGMDNRLPEFVYFVKGLFPISVQAVKVNHTPNGRR